MGLAVVRRDQMLKEAADARAHTSVHHLLHARIPPTGNPAESAGARHDEPHRIIMWSQRDKPGALIKAK